LSKHKAHQNYVWTILCHVCKKTPSSLVKYSGTKGGIPDQTDAGTIRRGVDYAVDLLQLPRRPRRHRGQPRKTRPQVSPLTKK